MLRGLLFYLEMLAEKCNLIDQRKYEKYRASCTNTFGKIPNSSGRAMYFRYETIRMAFSKVYSTNHQGKNVLVRNEYAVAAAKLIQQF